MRGPLPDRLFAKTEPRDDCIVFTGATNREGYGVIGAGGRGEGTLLAHRVSWEMAFGPHAPELVLDHVRTRGCNHRACILPEHLEPVTQAENARRTATGWCRPGLHPHAGRRQCPACVREKARAKREAEPQQEEKVYQEC